jgi:hypothetical protein
MDLGDDATDGSVGGDDDVRISTNVITGVRTSSTLQLHASVQGARLTTLVDSGSTHSVTEAVAHRIGLVPEPRPSLSVGVANGDRVPCSGICTGIDMTIGDKLFVMDFYVILLDGYDIFLGCEWLCTLGPIVWDFAKLSMTFWFRDHRVQWTGIGGRPSPRLYAAQCSNPLETLLAEFEELFAAPTGLPPPRSCGYRIHLLPNTPPLAVRPYQYAQLLKDKFEEQCQAILE